MDLSNATTNSDRLREFDISEQEKESSIPAALANDMTQTSADLPIVKRVLTPLCSNQLISRNALPSVSRKLIRAKNAQPCSEKTPSSIAGSKASAVALLTSSALQNLPRIIGRIILQGSNPPPGLRLPREQVLGFEDTMGIRRRLATTGVPLSRRPKPLMGEQIDVPRLRDGPALTPVLVIPDEPSPEGLAPQHRYQAPFVVSCDDTDRVERFLPIKPPPTRTVSPMLSLFATVKITNIPWDASTEQIMDFLGKNTRLAPYTSVCSPVHFVLDRTSGKTQSDIYVEINTSNDAERFAQRKSGKNIGSRTVNVELVSSKEMLSSIFPRYRPDSWLTTEEIQNLLTHAKTFKSPYTRKCPQRPFENFISILALFPWADKTAYLPRDVELLYMGYVSIVSILQWHIRKGKIPYLNRALLERLVIAGTHLTDFTAEQKEAVCALASFHPTMAQSEVSQVVCLESISKPECSTSSSFRAEDFALKNTNIADSPKRRSPESLPQQGIATAFILDAKEPVASKRIDYEEWLATSAHLKVGPISTEPDATILRASLRKVASSQDLAKRPAYPVDLLLTPSPLPCSVAKEILTKKLSPLTGTTLREKWLENARKAGIAVGVPAGAILPR